MGHRFSGVAADGTAGPQIAPFPTTASGAGALTSTGRPTFDHTRPPGVVPGTLHRAAAVAGDLLGAAGLVLIVPFVILAIGLPIALCLRLMLWLAGML